jgi:primase-polymerase (primpol)-like protein
MRECGYCGKSIVYKNAQARFCSDKCRNYNRRRQQRNPIPAELIKRDRWVRWNATKVPLTATGSAASSTNPSTWTSFTAATASTAGVGIGYVLGDGIGCIDLDHCLVDGQPNAVTQALLDRLPPTYVEISPSGDGLHVIGLIPESAGRRFTRFGQAIEIYSRQRYVTMTGKMWQGSTGAVRDISQLVDSLQGE